MLGEVIAEYLVELGADVDTSSFAQIDAELAKTGNKVDGLVKRFTKAGGIITGVLSGFAGGMIGLVGNIAKQDLAMQKYATSMMISTKQAYEMKNALDALGESAADVQLNPELRERYNALVNDNRRMMPGADFEATQRQVRDILFEFQRLKQEATYILKWIGYYIVKDFAGPLSKAGKSFRELNEYIIRNMPRISREIADGFGYIINICINFGRAIFNIAKYLARMWESFPSGVKKAIVAIALLTTVIKATPVGRLVMALGTLLLLIDDFFGYLDGKDAALGPIWDKLIAWWNEFSVQIDTAMVKLQNFWRDIDGDSALTDFVDLLTESVKAFWELASAVIELSGDILGTFWDALKDVGLITDFSTEVKDAGSSVKSFWKTIIQAVKEIAAFIRAVGKTQAFKDFIHLVAEALSLIIDLIKSVGELTGNALGGLWKIFKDLGVPKAFNEAIKEITGAFVELTRGIFNLLKLLGRLLKLLVGDPRIIPFWNSVGKMFGEFNKMLIGVLMTLGKIGKVIGLLLQGDFAGAARVMGFSSGSGVSVGEVGEGAGELVAAFVRGGMTEIAAAALVGNMDAESGLRAGIEVTDNNGLPATGLAQWNGPRSERLKNFAAERGKDWKDRGIQVEYAIWEMKTYFPDVWKAIQSAGSVDEASNILLHEWEMPLDQSSSVEEFRAGKGRAAMQAYQEIKPEKMNNATTEERIRISEATNPQDAEKVKEASGSIMDTLSMQYQALKDIFSGRRSSGEDFSNSFVEKHETEKRPENNIVTRDKPIIVEAPAVSVKPTDVNVTTPVAERISSVKHYTERIIERSSSAMQSIMPEVKFDNATLTEVMEVLAERANGIIATLQNTQSPFSGKSLAYAYAPPSVSNAYSSHTIGDINIYVTKANASAKDIAREVGITVTEKLNMPERPIIRVRNERGVIG